MSEDDLMWDAALVKPVTAVVRDADAAFELSGGSSRHWVREQFLPRLGDAGLVVVQQADLDTANARIEEWVQHSYESDERANAANTRADEAEAVMEAAYFLLNSDQCIHGEGDWRNPTCRVCNLRSAFDGLSAATRDRLASLPYAAAREAVRHE